MILQQDASGDISGYFIYANSYYYQLQGQYDGAGNLTFTDVTTGSQYTGVATGTGSQISITGTFIYPGGSTYSWSAATQ